MIKIVGDINFTNGFFDTGFGVGSSIISGKNPFINIPRSETDLWIGNFECVTANVSNKTGIYQKQFLISPDAILHFKHFDIYGVANNHVMQHGPDAYNEMLDFFEKEGIGYVGSVNRKHIIFNHQGKKFGILAFSLRPEKFSDVPLYWSFPDVSEIQEEIESLKECDFKIAYIHWGNEFINYPYMDQKIFAHCLVDIGVDLIIGMHPHVMHGYEVYKGKYIFYSLGNFVFNMPSDATKYSVIIDVDVKENELNIGYEYVKIKKDYFPTLIDENCMPKEYTFEYLNNLIGHKEENEVYYLKVQQAIKHYRKENYKDIFCNLRRFKLVDFIFIIRDYILRGLK